MNQNDAIETLIKRGRRRSDIYRKGRVTAVDSSVSPRLITVGDRKMPVIAGPTPVKVGDLVVWVDVANPFAHPPFEA